jgi:DNA processing protein
MNEVKACLILSHAPYLSQTKIRQLTDHFGSAESAFHAIHSGDLLPFTLRAETSYYFLYFEKQKAWQEDLTEAEKKNAHLIPYTSKDYPQKLKILSDCPAVLYVKGKLPQENSPAIGIIGTRYATNQGKELAMQFAHHLARAKVVIVSGLARGIDTSAHKGSLQAGITVAVIGSGLSCLYPKENSALADEICLQGGAIISEQPMKSPPTRFTFPKRNRIISALSDALLLAEAPMKSGAMITMDIALKQNKPLFALPGKALSPTSEGNHSLIKAQLAKLVDHPDELLKMLGFSHHPTQNLQKSTIPSQFFSSDEQKILQLLENQDLSLEEIREAISLPIAIVQARLSKLILQKIVLELPGKRYKLF